jgi:HK97 family phage major capsid protein
MPPVYITESQNLAFEKHIKIRGGFVSVIGKETDLSTVLWRDLHEERSNLRKAANAFLEKIEKEKREMSDDEDAAWQALLGRTDQMTQQMDIRTDKKEAIEMLDGNRGTASPSSELSFIGKDGRQIRGLRVGDPIDTETRHNLPDGIKADDLNLGRWFRGIVTSDWSGAEAERRAMGGNNDVLGGYVVPLPLAARVIDLARNQARVMQAGAITVPMDSSTLKLGQMTADPTAHWRHENVEATFSDASFGLLTLDAKTLVAMTKISIELVEDAANIPQLVEAAMASALALELDRAALCGAGAGAEPQGIRYADGIQTIDMGTNGAALTSYDDFSTAWEYIQNSNGPSEGISAIYAPRTAGAIDRMKDGQGLPLQPPESFKNIQKLVTNQVPVDLTKGTADNASEAYVGDFSNLLMGMRTNMTMEVSREAADSSGSAFRELQLWVRIYLRADVALMRPNHFVLINGIIPAS